MGVAALVHHGVQAFHGGVGVARLQLVYVGFPIVVGPHMDDEAMLPHLGNNFVWTEPTCVNFGTGDDGGPMETNPMSYLEKWT